MAVVVADLLALQREINQAGPHRDHRADGTYGDARHRTESSDHNLDDTPGVRTPFTDPDTIPEVHALDADSSGPWLPGWSMARIVAIVVTLHRTGTLDVLQNVIYQGQIWSRSWGWTARKYTGADQHTGHAHFSSRYGSGAGAGNPENYTGSWGIVDALTGKQKGPDTVEAADVWAVHWGEADRLATAKDKLFEAADAAAATSAKVEALTAAVATLSQQVANLVTVLAKSVPK